MAHIDTASQQTNGRTGILIALVLSGLVGFAVGQVLPDPGTVSVTQTAPGIEDWHGNVRRSWWDG